MSSATSSSKTPVIYLHTHWDREWYQPFRMYQVRLAEVVDAILERLEAGVFPCFMLDGQTVLLDDYIELRPERKAQLERLIQEGKLRIGPWYVMPDEFLVSGESLVRNLKQGILASKAYGQQDSFCGYLPDTFGHSADIPTILSLFDIKTAVVWRGVNPTTSEFIWESPSGQTVLGYYLADGYFQMMLHQAEDDPDLGELGKEGALKRLADKLSNRTNLPEYLVPIGGDHLGPLDKDAMCQLKMLLPDVKIETPEQFLNRIPIELVETQIRGELTNNDEAFLLPGVYSSRVYLKKSNRILEHAVIKKWEPLQAMVSILAKTLFYPHELQTAWKTLLLNHPHDSICGCSVDAVHRHNEVRFEDVNGLYQAVMPRLQVQLEKAIGRQNGEKTIKPSDDGWLVVNTLDRPYSGVVPVQSNASHSLIQIEKKETILEDGYQTDFMQVPLSHKTIQSVSGWVWVEDIPPFGVKAFSKKEVTHIPEGIYAKLVGKNSIENERYVLTVNDSGSISVTDKKTGKHYQNLHQFRDIPQQGDSYNAAPAPGASIQVATLKKIRPWQKGPLVAGLLVTYQMKQLTVESRIWLEAGSPQIFFETTFENQKTDHCLQIGFETDKPIEMVMAESHFSLVSRSYDPLYQIEDHMPVASWKELKTNTGAIQRFVTANGQAFFTEGINEYEVTGNHLYLTLLRAFGTISRSDTGVRGAQAGPPFETPEGQCLHRPISLRYGWMPLNDESFSDLSVLADRFLGHTMAMPSNASDIQPFSLIRWENPHIGYSACYSISEHTLILRLLNRSENEQQLAFDNNPYFQQYQFANGLDEPISQPILLSSPLVFRPFELKTLLLSPKD